MLQQTTEKPSTMMNGVDVTGLNGTLLRKGCSRVHVKISVEGAVPAEVLQALAKFSPVHDIVSNSLPVEVSVPRHRNIASSCAPGESDVPVYDIEPNSLPVDVLAARQRYLAACGYPTSAAGSGQASRLKSERGAPERSDFPAYNIVANSLPIEVSV